MQLLAQFVLPPAHALQRHCPLRSPAVYVSSHYYTNLILLTCTVSVRCRIRGESG